MNRKTARSLAGLALTLVGLVAASLSVGCTGSEADDEGAAAGVSAQTADGITLQNWEEHPKLKAIFELRSVAFIAERERLWKREAKDNLCEGSGEESRTMMTDDDGRIRSLAVRAGSDDSYGVLHTLYDAAGRLRYVESTLRTVRGTGKDHLVFFDTQGAILWEVIQPWTPGPDGDGRPAGWRTPRTAAEDQFDAFEFDDPDFISNPARVFGRAPRCN